jgi:hypothetical protein
MFQEKADGRALRAVRCGAFLWLSAQELHSTSVNLASLRVALRFNETVSRSPVAGEAITPLSGCKVEEVEWLATMSISS